MTHATAIVSILGGLPVRAHIAYGEVVGLDWIKGGALKRCMYDKLPDGWEGDVVKQVLEQFEPWELEDTGI